MFTYYYFKRPLTFGGYLRTKYKKKKQAAVYIVADFKKFLDFEKWAFFFFLSPINKP